MNDRTAQADSYDLSRFTAAQETTYPRALNEIRAGRKTSHWMWFVFPQVAGLGLSEMSRRYSIGSLSEARAYLADRVLGPRLVEITEAVCSLQGRSALHIFGSPDDMKLRSSMTLFAAVSPADSPFHRVLGKYFGGKPDTATLRILGLE